MINLSAASAEPNRKRLEVQESIVRIQLRDVKSLT